MGEFTAICGPSGSGKSSLAFETLYAEGQRRFVESLSNYARQFLERSPKPQIEGIENIPPAVALEQHNSVKNARSTVGTATELIDHFRLLFEKLGRAYCPYHNLPVEKLTPSQAADKLLETFGSPPPSPHRHQSSHPLLLEEDLDTNPRREVRGYILVEVPKKDRVAKGGGLAQLLEREGLTRLYFPQSTEGPPLSELSFPPSLQITPLDEIPSKKKGLPSSTFYVVIDRLSFSDPSPENRLRLVDSLQQAYETSLQLQLHAHHRQALGVTTEGKFLRLSEETRCPDPQCTFTHPVISSQLLSFNSPVGACPTCKGFGNILDLDEDKIVPNKSLSLNQGALVPLTMPSATGEKKTLVKFCKKHRINMDKPWMELSSDHRQKIWAGDGETFVGIVGLFKYLDQMKYKMHVRVFISRFRSGYVCPACQGARLRPEALTVRFNGLNIQELSSMRISEAHQFFSEVVASMNPQWKAAGEVLRQIQSRLGYLMRVGVDYLTLNRETRSLSGGEYQRIMLANQLGLELSQTLYVLDEPTVGLHPRDNDRLISILKDMQKLGNTLVVVEHDYDVITSSDHIIEMGPGSGQKGGEVIYSGPTVQFDLNHLDGESRTDPFLLRTFPERPVVFPEYKHFLRLIGARSHNLKNLQTDIPLNRLVTITGVSGSGKSTLINKTLYPALVHFLTREKIESGVFDRLEVNGNVHHVVLIDQSPIGRTSRSSPVTFMKIFDEIRNLLADVPESRFRGYTSSIFSLNVDGGRCSVCKGTGYEEVDMMFMDDFTVPCDTCRGKKYREEILEIHYRGKNIDEILNLTVSEALQFFIASRKIRRALQLLHQVGLGYLKLGQSASTLSGGESQRLKIAKELSEVDHKSTVYILDEPTTGLHFREVSLLMKVLHHLVEGGGSVILIEHNLDVIGASDYIIDLGPEAGDCGGQIVALGSPEQIIESQTLTGRYLQKWRERKNHRLPGGF